MALLFLSSQFIFDMSFFLFSYTIHQRHYAGRIKCLSKFGDFEKHASYALHSSLALWMKASFDRLFLPSSSGLRATIIQIATGCLNTNFSTEEMCIAASTCNLAHPNTNLNTGVPGRLFKIFKLRSIIWNGGVFCVCKKIWNLPFFLLLVASSVLTDLYIVIMFRCMRERSAFFLELNVPWTRMLFASKNKSKAKQGLKQTPWGQALRS